MSEWLLTLVGILPEFPYVLGGACIMLFIILGPLLSSAGGRRRSARRSNHHSRFKRYAARNLNTLEGIDNDARRIGYLRTINPFVFEEMILNAFEKKGQKVFRNSRYTGDGGVDGKVVIGGHLHLIQAKRYRNHIRRKDLVSFAEMCNRQGCQGLFIHTGKTGRDTALAAKGGPISVISGSSLLQLLSGK